jgi:hypothetical protein
MVFTHFENVAAPERVGRLATSSGKAPPAFVGTLAIQGDAALMSREALLLNGSARFDANSSPEVPAGTCI